MGEVWAAFGLGAVVAVGLFLLLAAIFDTNGAARLEECRKTQNVYRCELIAIPVKP